MTQYASGTDIIDQLNAQRNARIADDTKMQCKICWYVYDPEQGCPENQTPADTPFNQLPEWWTCPDCGNGKQVFIPFVDVEDLEAFENRMRALQSRHLGTSLKVFNANPGKFFETGFNEILVTRMAGLPIVNKALTVSTTEFVRIAIDDTQAWFGVVVTPWSVMAILAPASRDGWRFIPAGGFEEIELAAGVFRFIACADKTLGHYRSLSLKALFSNFKTWLAPKLLQTPV